jgi:rare lipoprotein A
MRFLIHAMRMGMNMVQLARRSSLALGLVLLLAGCGTTGGPSSHPGGTPSASAGNYKLGQPYQVNGRWYRPEYDPSYVRTGTASWYGADFHGLPTANGEVFDKEQITAAHPTLPLPSIVRVTNLDNGRSVDVRVNDRGPFVGDRLIDLSQAAARKLGYEDRGLAPVRVEFLGLADARGTPPQPTIIALRPAPVAPAVIAVAAAHPVLPSRREAMPAVVMLASATTSVAPTRQVSVRACPMGEQFVQIGAFGDTAQVMAALAAVEGLERVRVEPAFAGNKAVARVRLGPVANVAAASRLLERVSALGYPDAFMIPARPAGDAVQASC